METALKKGPGRPTKRTKERMERIALALRGGNTRKAACAYAGISEDAFARWIKDYSDFADLVARAEGECEVRNVSLIQRAATEREVTITKVKRVGEVEIIETRVSKEFDWQAAAWWLERRRPEDWQKRDKLDVEASVNVAKEIVDIVRGVAERPTESTLGAEEDLD